MRSNTMSRGTLAGGAGHGSQPPLTLNGIFPACMTEFPNER
jgi:hypothetical protein